MTRLIDADALMTAFKRGIDHEHWISEDCTESATYVPCVGAVRYSQAGPMKDEGWANFATVYLSRDTLEILDGLFPTDCDGEDCPHHEGCTRSDAMGCGGYVHSDCEEPGTVKKREATL